ncbi:MAG: O-sialoglycoprotein endopeptidase [Parcubacteria bacterium C7867-007]|nr:MAG: O-sialoglycoprotein endopeptidase [Parcubacteria bacterium C7867-007]
MKLLAIETSCDETAIAILECTGDDTAAQFTILGNTLLSQIEIHRPYGGVFPALAKREHAKNLVPILEATLSEAEMLREDTQAIPADVRERILKILEREPDLGEAFMTSLSEMETPDIDAIAVTAGPGLEPALWVGVNFARALAVLWDKPLISTNHMEGHTLSALVTEVPDSNARVFDLKDVQLPLLALLISGGHTEIVGANTWREYRLVGQTRDDAVGEAFDKVARMMHLPYPGGPEISKLAERNREDGGSNPYTLPRPMIDTKDCDFSFSGLKTSVLYLVKDKELSELDKQQLAHAFEDAVSDVLYTKTSKALIETGAKSLAIGGGVSASTHIRRYFQEHLPEDHPEVKLFVPPKFLTGDNAVMIGIAAYYSYLHKEFIEVDALTANGNRSLSKKS